MARGIPGAGRAWGLGIASLLALLLGPLLLFPTPLGRLAEAWAGLLLLAAWCYGAAAFVGLLARANTPPLALLERGLRLWVARFAPDPEALWLHWTRHAYHPDQAWWCLDRAVRLGGSEGIFQEGLVYLEGGFGPGGVIDGVQRMGRAARRGHAEAAFRYAEALRTGHGVAADPVEAGVWYRRAASADFGPAAAWLARACEAGDGLAVDPEEARRWSGIAARLAPHPSPSRSPLRHDAAPDDPLVRLGGRLAGRVEAVAEPAVSHPAGRWILLLGLVLLAGGALATVGAFFWAGSSGLHHLPLLMLAPPVLALAWQAWRLRREGPRRGRDRLLAAAESGDPGASYRLGLAFLRGDAHRPKDDLSAVLWFRKAAEAGHREAMLALAEAYRGGHGVVRDPRAAARWEEAART
ncbi:hypothetical protein GETHPA_19940 [Geothrix rubra]|uniref:Sel1 repeat family protein n=1 Tax=Geothrix rubra TaxID=2927977 RepID=A0ABQ5Q7S8_9BACT|nr:hypothetical protein [Geothrix rubra]GLH70461.1 hypothetical protein GETHPA_19940 [Geothrix rubra]